MNPLIHIIDDDSEGLVAMSHVLSSHGYATRIYSSAVEFLVQADREGGCVLLDLKMPHIGGGSLQEELARRGIDLPLIVMSSERDLASAVEAMKLGAADFLVKPAGEEELLSAVGRAVDVYRRGEDRRKARRTAAAKLRRLSRRERQILQGLLSGLSNKSIARRLGLSPRTVEMHRANMMAELAVATLSEALRLAMDAELPRLPGDREPAEYETPPPPPADSAAEPEPSAGSVAEQRALEDRALVELSQWGGEAGIWDFDLRSRTIGLSRRCRDLHGVKGTVRLTVEQWAETVHPDDIEAVRAAVRNAIRRGGCWTQEFRTMPRDGECRRLLILCKRVDDPAERPMSVVGLTQELGDPRAVLKLGSSRLRRLPPE